ncbi:MAG: response regulator [Hyphomonadaceae bacterium]|nr:response regulator [Hyphomonadaceae bacterium]
MPATASRHLILVDDDPDVLDALRFAFEMEGYEVSLFSSGEQLLAQTPPGGSPACIVIDERLPGVTGMDTLQQLRARGFSLPAILITSHPSAALQRRAAAAKVEIVEKPLLSDALARKVEALLI